MFRGGFVPAVVFHLLFFLVAALSTVRLLLTVENSDILRRKRWMFSVISASISRQMIGLGIIAIKLMQHAIGQALSVMPMGASHHCIFHSSQTCGKNSSFSNEFY